MILKLLLITRIIWMIFMKLLMNKVFDNLIVDTLSNKKPQSFVTDLFITSRKINISLVFITQSYFVVLKSISRNPIQYFIIKHPTTQSFTKFQSIMYLIMTFMTSGSFAKMSNKTVIYLSHWYNFSMRFWTQLFSENRKSYHDHW